MNEKKLRTVEYSIDQDPPIPKKIKISVPLLILLFFLYQLMALYLITNLLSNKLLSVSVIISLLIFIIMTVITVQTYNRWKVLDSVVYHEHIQKHVLPMAIEEWKYQLMEQNQWGISEEDLEELQ